MEIKCAASTAQRFDVRGNGNGFDAIWIVRVLDAKRSNFCTFAQDGIATHHTCLWMKVLSRHSWTLV